MIDNDEFKIPGEYIFKPNNNVDLDWMNDKGGFEGTAERMEKYFVKEENNNELKLIKDFITKINNGTFNKNKAGNEFKNLKQIVTNYDLRYDFIKELERDLFGEDIKSIEPEEKYEESIAERVKTRRQNTQRTFAPSSPPKKDYSEETANFIKYMEEEKKGQKKNLVMIMIEMDGLVDLV